MLTVLHYLPYLLLAGLIGFCVLVLTGGGRRGADDRRRARPQYYRWQDDGARRDR